MRGNVELRIENWELAGVLGVLGAGVLGSWFGMPNSDSAELLGGGAAWNLENLKTSIQVAKVICAKELRSPNRRQDLIILWSFRSRLELRTSKLENLKTWKLQIKSPRWSALRSFEVQTDAKIWSYCEVSEAGLNSEPQNLKTWKLQIILPRWSALRSFEVQTGAKIWSYCEVSEAGLNSELQNLKTWKPQNSKSYCQGDLR